MRNSQLFSSFSKSIVYLTLLLSLVVAESFAVSRIRNKGNFYNNSGSVTNCNGFNNGKTGAGGRVWNGGTITIQNGAGFFNYDSVTTSGAGIFRNLSSTGNARGTIQGAVTFDNGTTANGTFINDSTTNANSGIVKFTGTFTNTAAANFSTQFGTVEFNGGTQSIPSTVLGKTYGALTVSAAGTKSLSGDSVYAGTLNLTAGTLDENGKVLVLNGTVTGGGTLTANGGGSTTVYNGAAQSVLSASYYNLAIQNGNTKTALNTVSVVAGGSLTVANSTIFDMSTYALTLSPVSTSAITNNGTIQTQAINTAVSVAVAYQIGGTFIYNNSTGGSQTVAAVNYNNLTYSGTGTRAITGTVGIAGTFTPGSVSRAYTGSTVNYNGSAAFGTLAQNIIGGELYFNLGVSGGASQADTATHKTVTTGNLSLGTGVLSIAANTNLDMKTFTGTWNATSTLPSTAKIMWQGSNTFVSGAGVTEFYGGASTVATGATYGNILFTGTGAMTISSAVTATGGDAAVGVTVSSNLTVTGTTLTVSGMDFVNDGVVTNNGTITVN